MLDGGQGVQGRGVIKGRKHWEKCNGIVKKIYLKNKKNKRFFPKFCLLTLKIRKGKNVWHPVQS